MTGRVLVVDDVEQNVKLLEAKLTSEYYTVFTASGGQEAIAIAEKEKPDIILLDVMMPGMDGFEACKRIKSNPQTSYIPVIMVTALDGIRDRVRGLESGADDFITKPIDEIHLFARVKSLIRVKMMLDELRMRDRTGAQFGINETAVFIANEPLSGNIIVIDDDVVQSRKIKDILSKQKYNVKIEHHDLIPNIIAEDKCSLLIINTSLDGVDGLRLGVQIRSQEKSRNIPIMILIDEDDKQILAKGLEVGIDDYLTIPFDENELIARVSTQIRRKKYQDKLRENYQESISAAVIDALTGLYNRRYLDAHLNNIVEEAKAKSTPLCVMMIDIDYFKRINDKEGWGHHIGDEVLRELTARIMETVRSMNLATRYGGEEFVVVMPNTDVETAMVIAERGRKIIEERPFKISAEPGSVQCTVSIGVASFNHADDTAETLLKRADEALYKAKNSGRNKVLLAD